MLIGRRSNYKDEEIMDRRGFLKLGALLPFYKKVIEELIENKAPEPVEELIIDGPLPLHEYAKAMGFASHTYTDVTDRDVIYYDWASSEPIFEPDPDRIGEFIAVGRTRPFKTGHNDT